MTAPAAVTTAAAPEVDLNDDALVSAAIGAALERKQHLLPDEPVNEPEPVTEPAKAEAAPEGEEAPPEGEEPPPPDPFATLLADAKPLTYKRSGRDETFDGILEIPGKGALIPSDKVDHVRNLIARHEANAADTQRLYGEIKRYERLTYKDSAQAEHKGLAAVHRMQEEQAYTNASSGVIFEHLMNPQKLLSLLARDEQGNLLMQLSREGMSALQDRARFAGERAAFDTQSRRSTEEAEFARSSQEEAALGNAIPDAIDRAFPDADAATRAEAKEIFGPLGRALMFQVTPEQAAEYGQPVGTWMVATGRMEKWFADRLTARSSTSAAQAAAAKAAADNARRTPPKAATPTKKAPTLPRDPDNGQWVRPTRLSPSEIMDRSLAGLPIGSPALTE